MQWSNELRPWSVSLGQQDNVLSNESVQNIDNPNSNTTSVIYYIIQSIDQYPNIAVMWTIKYFKQWHENQWMWTSKEVSELCMGQQLKYTSNDMSCHSNSNNLMSRLQHSDYESIDLRQHQMKIHTIKRYISKWGHACIEEWCIINLNSAVPKQWNCAVNSSKRIVTC